MLNIIIFSTLFLIVFMTNLSFSQQFVPVSLDKNAKEQTIEKIQKLLNDNYVFPETAKKMSEYLGSNFSSGKYNNTDDAILFAEMLTADMQFISKDKHLRVTFNPEESKAILNSMETGSNAEELMWNDKMKKENYGFFKAERLQGNIGYVDFRTNYAGLDFTKETIKAAMGFLSNSDAIIFDLRKNGGAHPECIQLLCSYFFNDEPVHLDDLYYRIDDKTVEYWTLKKIDGKRMPDVPLYILTSNYTFSGAEEFAYNLKNLKRAKIIGETTGGGANPGTFMYINDNYTIFIPSGRAINPVTKTNWEGVGVLPDINVKSEHALEQAHISALEDLSGKVKDKELINKYNWIIGSLKAALSKPETDENTLKYFAGIYNDRIISFENGKLFYQRSGRQKFEMIPMTEDTFMLKDLEFFRIQFAKDSSGNVTELIGLYDDGHKDISARTN